ncbi:uncharacterized protein PITG_18278 [Phytophthora infestans T30-4]|uniref:Uncharacterized protein n=1 Tax=Phytophthora infestans (strain T30-4) TaxID=403677 RepID=D0NXS5_PHYIT|nr:uncharacterized protein PITG_18278 [Phytophthora infestans T30-4]EEY67875.1 conserved hypothetical protein [Phytophthora infestans T30-4]|eukprot:XP_002997900.1 conserved hypothetical protein [Phytophthora infestans T30-4]
MGHLLNTTENQPEAKLSMPIPSVHEKTTTPNSNQASKLDPRNANAQAEEHARSVKMLPAEEKKQRRLKCVGWRGTSHCTPHGPRDPTSDKGCYDVVINSASGYCEVEDQDTDFWHPGHTIFNIHGQSLLWEILGTAFVNSFEQESGQLLIDRRRHTAPLELVKFYTVKSPNPFTRLKLAYGDKDLFRFAWMKLNMPFTMIQSPLAVAGKVINGSFCGMTMVQHDMKGEVLFLHRNSNKLSGEVKRKKVYHRAQAINNVREKLLRQGICEQPQ